MLFLYQSIEDYADVDKYADLFSDGLQALLKESLVREIPEFYAGLLVNVTYMQKEECARVTLEHLEKLALNSQYARNEEIVLMYAFGLFNLAAKQKAREAETTVKKLEKLAGDSRYAENEKIVLAYATGLFNLVAEQEAKEAEATVEKLEELAGDSRYAGNEEIVLMYAKGLVNLAAKQEVKEAETTVEKLEELAGDSQYAGNEEIVLMYAKGLYNLAADQEAGEANATVEKLEGLAGDSRYARNEEIVLEYAKGLVNLGFDYYSQHDYEQAEKRFAQAHQLRFLNGSINLCYMIRRRETKTRSLDEFKEILLSVWEEKNAFSVTNMALYLGEYEDDWHGADDLISSLAETEDFSGVIDWWSHLEELEGLLVMTWLERNKICDPCYILEGEIILKSLRKKYPGIPDWMIEIRREE